MKLFLRSIIFSLLFLQACKKDSLNTPDLNISGFGPTAFATGDAISIYGSGFDTNPDKNIVSFNGVNGEVATATPNRLQVIVPLLTTSGKITVTVHGKNMTCPQTYNIVNVLQGTYSSSFILTADKKYLLRGNVIFNSKLIIQAGTVIYGEKLSHGGLTAKDVDFEGTPDKPIVFTSDQAPGNRYPGDWTGLTINGPGTDPRNASIVLPTGTLEYVRIEYAGYGQANALNFVLASNSIIQYVQASYSGGGGIQLNGSGQFNAALGFAHHIVAFGCLGADFLFSGNTIAAQYGLGLKDPYYASVSRGDGIAAVATSQSGGPTVLSNFTVVGYNPDARNLLNVGPTISNNAGSGIHFGISKVDVSYGIANAPGGSMMIYNSVIAASWQAGVSFTNGSFNGYETGSTATAMLRNNFFTGTSPVLLPVQAGALGNYTAAGIGDGYFTSINTSPSRTTFAQNNDTTKLLSFAAGRDDLGIKNLTDYNRLNNPGVLPAAGSLLLQGASFPPGSYADNPFLNKDITYVGAFSTQDWTRPWCNFNPQKTQY